MQNDITIPPPIQPTQPIQTNDSFIKKNFTPKFIAVIVGLLIVGGGAYGYATYLAKKNYAEVTRLAKEGKEQEEELRQRRLDDPSDVSGWQIYRNEEYGFEFKYPGYLIAEEAEAFNRISLKPINEDEIPFMEIQVVNGDLSSIRNDSIRRMGNNPNFVNEKILLNNLDAVSIGYEKYREIYSEYKKYTILTIKSVDIELEDLQKILSTFKFIQ